MQAKIEIQKINVSDITPASYNPRIDLEPTDTEYQKLKRSIEEFGYVEPIVWNKKTGNLIGGHQRLKILLTQGVDEIEASVVDLPLDKEKALNVALNQIRGRWDEDKLAALLDELTKLPDFDETLTGFDLPEISEVLDRFNKAGEDDYDFASDVASITKPITKPGDIIVLGEHRLLNGRSDDPVQVDNFLKDSQINLVFTDPPYAVKYYGGNRPHGKARPKRCKTWEVVYQDNLSQPDYEKMLKAVFENMARYLAPGSAFYVWNGHRQFGPMHLMLTELGYRVSCVIVWAKPTFAIGYGDYNQQVEFALYGWKEDNGAHFWAGPTNESTLWEFKRDASKDLIHPTQKPVGLAQRAIRNSSKLGDMVVDFFGGSGSTLIAAESLGRRCCLIEAESKHCDAIVRRYIKFSPDKVSEEIKAKYLKEIDHE